MATSRGSGTGGELNLIRKHRDELLSSMISNPGGVRSLLKKIDSVGLLFPEAIKAFMSNPSLPNDDCAVAILNHLEIILEISYGYIPPVVQVLKEKSFLYDDQIAHIDDIDMLTANEFFYFSKKNVHQQEKILLAALHSGGNPIYYGDFDDIESQAESLQEEFSTLCSTLVKVALRDAGHEGSRLLKAQLIVLMQSNAKQNGTAGFLNKLEAKDSLREIFNFLISKKFLGYLSLQFLSLFEAFLPVDPKRDFLRKIKVYKKNHKEFFSNSILSLARLFEERGDLLNSASGLPKIKFALQINKWGERSFYQWSELLTKLCGWPDCFLFKNIEEVDGKILIDYSVLHFMVSRVFNTIMDDDILKAFQKFGVSYVVTGTELEKIAADETVFVHSSVQRASDLMNNASSTNRKEKRISQVSLSELDSSFDVCGGFQLQNLVHSPPGNILCCYCNLIMKNPVQTNCCKQAMCQGCLEEKGTCPDCGVHNPKPIFYNKCQKIISNLDAQCIENGCNWKGLLGNYEHHFKSSHSQEMFGNSNDDTWRQPHQAKSSRSHQISSSDKPKPKPKPPRNKLPAASVPIISLRPPKADIIESGVVRLNWEKPEINPSIKTKYTVYYSTLDDVTEWTDCGNVTSEFHQVYNLNPRETYFFKVQAFDQQINIIAKTKPTEAITFLSTPRKKSVSKSKVAIPIAPGKPVPLSVETNSVEIFWEPPETDLVLREYQVSVIKLPDPSPFKTLYSKPNSLNIENLSQKTRYCFAVRANYTNGLSSEVVQSDVILTNFNHSLHINGKPTVKSVNSSSICLEWRPSHLPVTAIGRYEISYSKNGVGKRSWKSVKTQDNIPMFSIDGLEPNTEYFFKVRAISLDGQSGDYSELSDVIQTKPLHASPPGTPEVLSCSNDYIELRWTRPTTGSNTVKHFVVQYVTSDMYHKQNGLPDNWPTFPEKYNGTRAKLYNLIPGISYCFKVAAISDGGFSASECTQWIQTKLPPPGPPGKPYPFEIEPTTILLRWEKPHQQHHDRITYNVHCIKQKCSDIILRDICTEEAKVDDLQPNTRYQFQIEALNSDGASKISPISDIITTKKEVSGPPGKPYVLRVTHNTVKLAWGKPSKTKVSHYMIQYQQIGDNDWIQMKTKKDETSIEISSDLQPLTKYVFKVAAKSKEGEYGYYSELSEPVMLKSAIPSAPGKPAGKSNRGAITLTWSKSHNFYDHISHYEISYYEDGKSDGRMTKNTTSVVEELLIGNLSNGKGYYFEVRAVTHRGERSEASFLSDLISSESIAQKFLPRCTRITDGKEKIPVHLLPKKEVYADEKNMLVKYDVTLAMGKKVHHNPRDKVLMLVGPTGSGKTTVINGLVNYILRVEYGDEFRYKLIHDTGSQVKSVTSWISAYTIYCEAGLQMNFNLTIIDTPGFGDTSGIERDMEITRQVKQFFEIKQGIPHLDGIGFVCQAGSVRLTPTQKYIFDSIFAMFGNDIKDNIFVLCTFCDGEEPPVINAVREAKIPAETFFKFNNSALYASNSNPMTELFWNVGITSFRDFFTRFEKVRPVSLRLTKEVLQERETLETIAIGLQIQITQGMNLIDRLKNEINILEKNRALIEDNKGFEYEVAEDVMVRVNLKKEEYTTNCLKCNMTCHFPCVFANDDQKKLCSAMKNRGSENASCNVCPAKCHWKLHNNTSFRMVTEKRKVRKIYQEVQEKYRNALDGKMTVEKIIESLKCEIDTAFEKVLVMTQRANACTQTLDQIAFRPNHLSDTDYIQLLIEAQLQEKSEGYQGRVKALQALKDRVKILDQAILIGSKATRGKRWWEKIYMSPQ